MYHNKVVKVLSIMYTFYTICTSGKNINHEQSWSLEDILTTPSISDDKHNGDLFVLLLENNFKRNKLYPELDENATWNRENKDILPIQSEKSIHHGNKHNQKLQTNCTGYSFITKKGSCKLCRQCGPHEVVGFPCTLFRDTTCRPFKKIQHSSRCVDLFKRKHNEYLLKKYLTLTEKQLRPHWFHVCLNYLVHLGQKTRRDKSVQKRDAGSGKLNATSRINKNISERKSNPFVKKEAASPGANNTTKINSFDMQTNSSTNGNKQEESQSEGSTGTAKWVFITIGVAVVFLIAIIIAMTILYKRKIKTRGQKSNSKNRSEGATIGLIYDSCLNGPDEITEKSKSTLSTYIDKDDDFCEEFVSLKALSARRTSGTSESGEQYIQIDREYEYLPHVKVINRSCKLVTDGPSLIRSCLSPCENENNVEKAMSTSSFLNSPSDDGNKLRGGNGEFHRRYVDVDYVRNDIDQQRQKHQNRNSSGWEQDSCSRAPSQKRPYSHNRDQEQRWKTSMHADRARNGSNTSSSARSYISIPPTSPSENYIEAGSDDTSVRSERSTPPTKMAWLTKSLKVDVKNEIRNYQASLGTQTESDNDITAPSCKTVFGTPWQFGGTFTSRGGMMQAKDSDVSLVVVTNAVAKGDYIDIYGAVFTDTTEIRKKLDFPARESLITPVVEYHAAPVNHFNRCVCVQLPHSLPEEFDASLIRVYTFKVDERGKTSLYTVPLWDKANDDRSARAYWEKGSDGCSIHVSTTHFSGYFCTLCETSSLPSICTMVFGSHVQITQSRREVRVILYIWDRRLTIKDYLERFRKQESDVDRQLLTDMQVPLLDDASSDSRLVMKMEVMGEDEDRMSWKHVSRPHGSRPLFKPLQVRKLSEIVHCCRQTDPIRVEWAFENAPRQIPSAVFQCCIDIMHVYESTKDYETAMREGSDDLMRTFYVRDLKVMTHPFQEQKPYTGVQFVDLKKALLETTDMAQTEKVCLEFGITNKDIGNFKKKYSTVEAFQGGLVDECLRRHGLDKFMNQLPNILERLHLTQILNALEARKILFREFTNVPGHSDAPAQTKTVSSVKRPGEIVSSDKDSTRYKSPYRRTSSSPNQRNRSTSPMNRRKSREDSRGSQRPDLHQQMSVRSDDVFFNNQQHHQPALDDNYNKSWSTGRESRQSRRHCRHRQNSPSGEDDEENIVGSQSVTHNRGRYTGQNTAEQQHVKNQRSYSSRADSVLNSCSMPLTDSLGASSAVPSRSTIDPSLVAHADPKDFAEPYPTEFLDDSLQQTFKKEFAVQKNLHGTCSGEYEPSNNISAGLYLSESGPQAIPPESREINHSSTTDYVPPYRKLSNDQRAYENSQSQDKDQTLKKELYGTHTVV